MKIRLYGTLSPIKKITGVINAVPNPVLPPRPETKIFLVDSTGFLLKDKTGSMLIVRK